MIEIIEKNGARPGEEEKMKTLSLLAWLPAAAGNPLSLFLSQRTFVSTDNESPRSCRARENDEKNWPVVGRRDDNESRLRGERESGRGGGAIKSSGYPSRAPFHALFPP